MAKPEWGTKRLCPSCGARYYDMRKDPPVCPSCGTTYDPEALLKSRRARPIPAEEPKRPAAVRAEEGEEVETEEAETEEAEADVVADEEAEDELPVDDLEEEEEEVAEEEDVLLEDASELGDEDDVGEVVEIEGEEER